MSFGNILTCTCMGTWVWSLATTQIAKYNGVGLPHQHWDNGKEKPLKPVLSISGA